MFDTKLLSSKFSKPLLNHAKPKVSKTDKSDPKRLRKDLPKLVKNIAPEDQMILIGESSLINSGPDDFDWWVKFDQFPQIKVLIFDNYLDFSQFCFDVYYKINILGKTYGRNIIEAARSDINKVQKRKFGLFLNLMVIFRLKIWHHTFREWL